MKLPTYEQLHTAWRQLFDAYPQQSPHFREVYIQRIWRIERILRSHRYRRGIPA